MPIAANVGRIAPVYRREKGTSMLRLIKGLESGPEEGKKQSPKEKAAWEKLVDVYKNASADDRKAAAALVERAKNGKRDAAVTTITPGTAAVLFFDYNKQNRGWSYSDSESYASQITGNYWHFTGQGISFLISGNIGDGQHRLAAIALADQPIEVPVTFGMTEDAIIALDAQRRRQPSDFLDIVRKETDSKRKQQVVKRGFHYLAASAKDEEAARPYLLRNSSEVVRAVESNRHMLEEAISIADDSVRGRSNPTMSSSDAAGIVFALLVAGWNKAKIIADLDVLQTGIDREGGASPLFVAADQLQKEAAKRERSSLTARYGAVVRAFQLHEQGAKAVRVSDIRSAMKPKNLPAPVFPGTDQGTEAA